MDKLLKHTIIYFIGKGLPGILSFIGLVYYSKLLNPEEYGKYALITSIVGIVNIIYFEWTRFGMQRFLPEYLKDQNRQEFLQFTTQMVFKLVSILFGLSIIVAAFFYFIENDRIDYWLIIIIFVLSVLQFLYTLFTQIFITELKPKNFLIANVSRAILSLGFSLLFLYFNFGYMSLVLGMIISYFIVNYYSILTLKLPRLNYAHSFDTNLLKTILHYSLPIAASASLSFVLSYSNRFIISYFRGDYETGLFSLGFDFSQQTITVLISIAATSAVPIAMKLYAEEGESSKKLINHLNKSLQLLFIISFPLVVLFFAESNEIIRYVLGSKFKDMNPYLIPLISLSAFILGIKAYYLDVFFYFKKNTKSQLYILILIAIINIILNIIAVPIYGYIGAIVSALITSVIALIITYIIVKRIYYIPLDIKPIIFVIISGVLMYFILIALGDSENIYYFILKSGIGVIVYLALIGFRFKKLIKLKK